MNIGIYIDNENIACVDCSDLMAGNPGIGGTEYCILLLAQAYKLYFPDDRVTLFVNSKASLPSVDEVVLVPDFQQLCTKASELSVDLLLVSAVHKGAFLSEDFFDQIESYKLKTITWGHNFYLSDFCTLISRCSYVKANVFVGRQQYDRYVDHEVIKKSTYIYNMYPEQTDEGRLSITNCSVTYIGSLVPTKGFHVLAGAWKQILQAVPEATLNVIGSGKLYGRNSKLGRYNIADKAYEDEFMPGLVDENGDVLPSVHFWGVLGSEKKNIIRQTCVGVVNPTGRTETFGISAIDFESMGVPVVTIAKGGFLDTVRDGETGILYGKTNELAQAVIALLQDEKKNMEYGAAGKELYKEFLPKIIVREWHELFCKVIADESLGYREPVDFMNSNLKKYRILNREIKNVIGREYPFSVIGLETFARKMLRRLGK